ncbi:50S ribosomal protein L6 [Candidatus Nucleicultrix amoebiphila]|jgi:large subunit ribosomal protein L6|uniref:Large ribosomal subunit protein uL6 n=1 Tax=Candidatus Nucleicultrix amoebiphila FS5 TaxID=1414854 RepID=A0A1W6N634_9PROT|nr:50S ribosomal protein L6 [Candidatus Nucleicultrix amoebiphila]ARN85337.1 50S ribosomal protein L6 [Candidatus Nucleicultrix amoebiphila FS5]
MSRVGKHPVIIPAGVDVSLTSGDISVKGKNGQLSIKLSTEVIVKSENGEVLVRPRTNSKQARMAWGTTKKLIQNLVDGVTKGFTKILEINGVGYRAAVQGKNLVLSLGFSHEVILPVPAGLTVKCEKPTSVAISGANKEQVGAFAAVIRDFRRPEPYKGKGVKYENEVIMRKEGKKK